MTFSRSRIILAAIAILTLTAPALAEPIGLSSASPYSASVVRYSRHGHAHAYEAGRVIGGRPKGCPHAYCGCGASIYVFGENRRDLWPARAWYRFPHVSARVGAVAVRPHHVAVIIGGSPGAWLLHDGNSGNGLTREHVRDLRGYTFVDPHGSRMARR